MEFTAGTQHPEALRHGDDRTREELKALLAEDSIKGVVGERLVVGGCLDPLGLPEQRSGHVQHGSVDVGTDHSTRGADEGRRSPSDEPGPAGEVEDDVTVAEPRQPATPPSRP